MKRNPVVVQDPENEVPVEVLAKAIVEVAEAARRLLGSRLTEQAIALLITDSIPAKHRVGIRAVQVVLRHAADLDRTYLKKGGAR